MRPVPSTIAQQWLVDTLVTGLVASGDGTHILATLGDGRALIWPATKEASDYKRLHPHKGAILFATGYQDGFLTGGDDGKFCHLAADGTVTLIAEHKMKWIDHVAASPDGNFLAYSYGKQVVLLNKERQLVGAFDHPSSPGGLCFSPNNKRLAVTHYNGVSLWWTNGKEQTPVKLTWKGSHLAVTFAPDGKILMTTMQEASLHGWRLSDLQEMRMQGYANKIRSFAWTAKGRYFVTSGAECVICWPFFSGGPWGKEPLSLGPETVRLVSSVTTHPKDEMLVAGYDDGSIIMSPIDGRQHIEIHPSVAEEGAAVVGLAWNGAGDTLFAALQNGYIMTFTVDSVARAITPDASF
jgi:WD40 repeat protein